MSVVKHVFPKFHCFPHSIPSIKSDEYISLSFREKTRFWSENLVHGNFCGLDVFELSLRLISVDVFYFC